MLNQEIAKQKLDEVIERGRTRATAVVQKVLGEVISDTITSNQDMRFYFNDKRLRVGNSAEAFPLHSHAETQVYQRYNFPSTFGRTLSQSEENWQHDLLVHNLNKIRTNNPTQRHLLRSVKTEVRGFLSDRFKRIDSRPIIDNLCKVLSDVGALPYDGFALDTRISLRAVLPTVFEPVKGEFVCLGISFNNSDYGHGALEVNTFILRLICNNGMLGEKTIRKVHLGSRLDENILYSARTYELDTQTAVSATDDAMRTLFSHEAIDRTLKAITEKAESTIDISKQSTALQKRGLSKNEVEQVVSIFKSPDVVNVPAGNTKWRLENAISWLANSGEVSEERKLELTEIATV